jgi:hypothetical protein
MTETVIPPLPEGLPTAGRDIVPHEGNGIFLGWTFQVRHRFGLRIVYYFIRPGGESEPVPCRSLLEAVNYLRGPAGLSALVNEHDN